MVVLPVLTDLSALLGCLLPPGTIWVWSPQIEDLCRDLCHKVWWKQIPQNLVGKVVVLLFIPKWQRANKCYQGPEFVHSYKHFCTNLFSLAGISLAPCGTQVRCNLMFLALGPLEVSCAVQALLSKQCMSVCGGGPHRFGS